MTSASFAAATASSIPARTAADIGSFITSLSG